MPRLTNRIIDDVNEQLRIGLESVSLSVGKTLLLPLDIGHPASSRFFLATMAGSQSLTERPSPDKPIATMAASFAAMARGTQVSTFIDIKEASLH